MLHRKADLDPLQGVWDAAEAARASSVFQTYAFARHWARCFGDEIELNIGWCADPPAVIPLICRARQWSLLGEGLFDYQDLVGAGGPEAAGEAAIWAAGRWQAPVIITGVPVTSPWRSFWDKVGLEAQRYSAALLRAAGGEDLAAAHPRAERRWQAAGAELERVSGRGDRRRLLDWLLERKAAALAAKQQDNVLGSRECRWMAQMVEEEPGVSELWQLRRHGEVIAGILCWVTAQVRWAYTIAYDPQAAAISPGILALYALLRHTRREGRAFNFLTGEQAFKQRFATGGEVLLRYQDHDA